MKWRILKTLKVLLDEGWKFDNADCLRRGHAVISVSMQGRLGYSTLLSDEAYGEGTRRHYRPDKREVQWHYYVSMIQGEGGNIEDLTMLYQQKGDKNAQDFV